MTTPICGWVVTNNLDNSLVFYNNAGQALDSITPNPDAPWRAAIGSQVAIADADDIPNPHLRQMATYLIDQGPDFLNRFISTIDTGLENVDPENFA